MRVVLDSLRGEDIIGQQFSKEGIAQNLCYRWSKEFLEAGKKRLASDTAREATSGQQIACRNVEKAVITRALVVWPDLAAHDYRFPFENRNRARSR